MEKPTLKYAIKYMNEASFRTWITRRRIRLAWRTCLAFLITAFINLTIGIYGYLTADPWSILALASAIVCVRLGYVQLNRYSKYRRQLEMDHLLGPDHMN